MDIGCGDLVLHRFLGTHKYDPSTSEGSFAFTIGEDQYTLSSTLQVSPSGIFQPHHVFFQNFVGDYEDLELELYQCSRRELQATGGIATHNWPPSFILARFLSLNRELVKGRRILELGAGLGIPSVVAVSCGAFVKLTDIHTRAMNWARLNLKTNSEKMKFEIYLPSEFPKQTPPSSRMPCACVGYLDWKNLTGGPDGEDSNEPEAGNYDVILGSDIIHENEHASLVASCLDQLLSPDGVAFVINGGPFSRFGIDKFPSELAARHLSFAIYDVPAWLKLELEENFLHHQFFVISK